MGPKKDFAVPTLEELGMDAAQATTPHRGGESVALKMLAEYIKDEEYIGTFEKPKTSPAAFEPQATTLLSPHLHFGSLSVRKFWWEVKTIMDNRHEKKQPTADAPTNLLGQLLFREMFFAAQAALGHTFSQTFGNKIAHFIPWRLQSTHSKSSDGKIIRDSTYAVDSEEAETWFRRWREGRTGFPWIDALMRQLKQEGWIHHLGRHSVACFLTRGGCYVSWERGVDVFQEWLIDRMYSESNTVLEISLTCPNLDEEASNAGNWMWLSCTAFFSQYYRCYSPIAFGKKWDPDGHFVRRYCPELKDFDKKYIYEPWRAPIQDQKKWGCRVTGDGTSSTENGLKTYPKPIFDFDKQRQACIDSMKQAYHVGLHGNDPEVLDGRWKEIFEFHDQNGSLMDTTNGPVDDGIVDEPPNKRRKMQEHEEENERHMGSE
jgi:cryptochrome